MRKTLEQTSTVGEQPFALNNLLKSGKIRKKKVPHKHCSITLSNTLFKKTVKRNSY